MGQIPHAGGGCNSRNYERGAKFLSILFPDVDRSNAVSMPRPAAVLVGTVEDPSALLALAPLTAHRTRATGVPFLLQDHARPKPLGLVGEFVADTYASPLMDFLICIGAIIVA